MGGNVKKIFILEDEIDLNEMISIELENRGYETNIFYNPKDFLKAFSEEKPDLLITDIRLPEISGLEIIQMVKNIDVLYPPIIVITAYNDILPQVLYNLGAESVIYKPFQLHKLTFTIERLCMSPSERMKLSIEEYDQYTGWIRKIDDTKMEDISFGRGGFSFSSEEKIGNNEIVEFSIGVESLPKKFLSGLGIVRWNIINAISKNDKIINKYGIEFVYLDEENRNYIFSLEYKNIIPYIPFKES